MIEPPHRIWREPVFPERKEPDLFPEGWVIGVASTLIAVAVAVFGIIIMAKGSNF